MLVVLLFLFAANGFISTAVAVGVRPTPDISVIETSPIQPDIDDQPIDLVKPKPGKLKCPPGDIINNCPLFCNTDYCPKDENDIRYCSIPFICPPPACKCPYNYLRAANGTCIPASSCPPVDCTRCNEAFVSCPPLCPTDNCRDATPSGKCPKPGYDGSNVECRPGCRCVPTYWRKNGTCVSYDQCDVVATPIGEIVPVLIT